MRAWPLLAAFCADWNSAPPAKRIWTSSSAAGGDCLEDIALLRSDAGIERMLGYLPPSPRAVETWKVCAKEAADKGIYVTWEFEPGFAFNKPSDIFRILDEVNSDDFGVMYDACHAHMIAAVGARQPGQKETLPGGAVELAQRLKGKINHIHLIDSDGTLHDDETSTHAPFGDGILDFDALVPVLLDSGIKHDWWTIDLCFWPDAWAVTQKCKEGIDAINQKFCS
jgi:sugar phosphate isomerase/epimerase